MTGPMRCLRSLTLLGLLGLALAASADPKLPRDAQHTLETLYTPEASPLWLRNGHLSPQAKELLEILRSTEQYGLPPEDYAVRTAEIAGESSERFDRALSMAALRFIQHLHTGRVRPREAKFDLREQRPALDLVAGLRKLAQASDVRHELETYEPQSHYYRLLKQQLAVYRTLAADPTRKPLPSLTRSVKAGERYAGTQELRAFLVTLGDLPASEHADDGTLDPDLVAGLRAFQARHGLAPDGVLGKRTFLALTMPLAQRVRQIELALERWRWLPALPAPLIVVNVPQFVLYAFPATGSSSDILEVPVIVGQDYPRMQTPIFSSAIETVVFRPYWDVPDSIVQRELLPSIRRDATYLERNDMEIVRGQSDNAQVVPPTPANLDALAANRLRLRQRPGPSNALGLVKFVLPNAYSVYLHGTPAIDLFNASRRAFSHGCVRVSDPVALAEFVLQNAAGSNVDEPWDTARIELAMCGTKTLRVPLAKPLPVMILYSTAVATERHGMLFFDDVYGHDRVLEKLLGRP